MIFTLFFHLASKCCLSIFTIEPTEHFGIYFGYIRRLFQSWVSPFKTSGLAVNERERKRLICYWCCFRDRAQRFSRQRNWRRTCVCAVTPPPTFANLIIIGSQAKHQILAQSLNRFLWYGAGLCTFARAWYPTDNLYKTHSYWVPNHPLNFSTVRPEVPKIWKRGAHLFHIFRFKVDLSLRMQFRNISIFALTCWQKLYGSKNITCLDTMKQEAYLCIAVRSKDNFTCHLK